MRWWTHRGRRRFAVLLFFNCLRVCMLHGLCGRRPPSRSLHGTAAGIYLVPSTSPFRWSPSCTRSPTSPTSPPCRPRSCSRPTPWPSWVAAQRLGSVLLLNGVEAPRVPQSSSGLRKLLSLTFKQTPHSPSLLTFFLHLLLYLLFSLLFSDFLTVALFFLQLHPSLPHTHTHAHTPASLSSPPLSPPP